jgi:hypothetical protein
MTDFIAHCGHCGVPLRDCTCVVPGRINVAPDELARIIAEDKAYHALLRDVRATIAAGLGQPLPPPAISQPIQKPATPAQRFVKKGFYMCCVDCGLEISYCACAARLAPDAGSSDARDESNLNRRIKECQGR